MKYRAVSHIHSTISYDGDVPLSEIASFMRIRGVDVVCITEHSDFLSIEDVHTLVDGCGKYSNDSVLLIPGLEVPSPDGHVLVIGVDKDIKTLDPISVIEQYAHSGFIVFPHPHRSAFTISHGLLEHLDALEVWNSQYDGKRYPRKRSLRYFNELRLQRDTLKTFAGLDFHRESHWGGPVIEIDASARTKDAVLAALKEGEYEVIGGSITITSDGEVNGSSHISIGFFSVFYITLISFLKGVMKILHKLHIRPPQRFKQWLRRII